MNESCKDSISPIWIWKRWRLTGIVLRRSSRARLADLPVLEFLERIGAYGKNREDGYSGIRLAGLLMFGRGEVIRDALPHYMVDYQERPEAKADKRWVDGWCRMVAGRGISTTFSARCTRS